MDDIQEKSLKTFEEMLKSIDKKELNNLIEEISSMDTLGEPAITEYFSQIEGQFAHFYFSEDIDNDCSKNNMDHFQSFQNISNQKYDKVFVTEITEINFNISLNNQHANSSFNLSSKSKKGLRKNALAA